MKLKLYNIPAESPVGRLIREIESAANENGLTLSRWQTNSRASGNVVKTITYVAHRGARPQYSRDADADPELVVTLSSREGKTENSEAFRALSTLRDDLIARIGECPTEVDQ